MPSFAISLCNTKLVAGRARRRSVVAMRHTLWQTLDATLVSSITAEVLKLSFRRARNIGKPT
jgi:hypothetical protein